MTRTSKMRLCRWGLLIMLMFAAASHGAHGAFCDVPHGTDNIEWPRTDFAKCVIDPEEFLSGGPRRDDIAAIDEPLFAALAETNLAPQAPLIALSVNGQTRGYPLAILMWHEIVNDVIGGVPVAVTYCPLCNAAIVFDRRHQGEILDFGTTGYLRHSDLVMYDRQSESWWQQYDGRGLIGRFAGAVLKTLPSRLIGFGDFQAAYENGTILQPPQPPRRAYGANPYIGYDSGFPVFFRGTVPDHIAPMARVVVVADRAWSFEYLAQHAPVHYQGLELTWSAGQASALDRRQVNDGRDVGSVRVTRQGQDVAHKVTFAFVVHAFEPQREIIHMRP